MVHLSKTARWWWMAGISGVMILLILFMILIALTSGPDLRDKYKSVPSDTLRTIYNDHRENFHSCKELEKEARSQGKSQKADQHHDNARWFYKEMKAIEEELRSRGKW
jgi:hypothetical protein